MRIVLLYLVVEVLAVIGLISWIGLGWTLLVLLAGAVLGLLLARREGVRAARALTVAVQNGRLAHSEATDGLLVALAGVLLFVPGLVTDVLALALLLPPVRGLVRRRLVDAAERRAPDLRTARIRQGVTIVEGDAVVQDAPRRPEHGGMPVLEGEVVDPDGRR